MSKRKAPKRGYRMITFKAFFDTDGDILDWWDGIDDGDRSDTLRDLIREKMGKSVHRKGNTFAELLDMRRDTLWIKDALNEMPAYLERLIQHVAATTMAQAVYQPANAAMTPSSPYDSALTNSDGERRERRMRKASW